MIDMNYKLRPGDVLEFISPVGSKGLGNLLTADDIKSQWNINAQQYEELLLAGLPVIRFGAGDVRHSEVAVDEFFRQMAFTAIKSVPEIVGTPYIAERLCCTSIWITEMVRRGVIPPACVVPGTGDGKPWKFYRTRIDEWIRRR
jgi:hypothetical protein